VAYVAGLKWRDADRPDSCWSGWAAARTWKIAKPEPRPLRSIALYSNSISRWT